MRDPACVRDLIRAWVSVVRRAEEVGDPMTVRALAEEECEIRARLFGLIRDERVERALEALIERSLDEDEEVIVERAVRVLTRAARRTQLQDRKV